MFYLFTGHDYYPEGGALDYEFYAPTLEDVKRALDGLRDTGHRMDWWHITNERMQIVADSVSEEVTA